MLGDDLQAVKEMLNTVIKTINPLCLFTLSPKTDLRI